MILFHTPISTSFFQSFFLCTSNNLKNSHLLRLLSENLIFYSNLLVHMGIVLAFHYDHSRCWLPRALYQFDLSSLAHKTPVKSHGGCFYRQLWVHSLLAAAQSGSNAGKLQIDSRKIFHFPPTTHILEALSDPPPAQRSLGVTGSTFYKIFSELPLLCLDVE